MMRNMLCLAYDPIIPTQGAQEVLWGGERGGFQPNHSKRLRMLLAALDTALFIEDMNVSGFRLHLLKGSERDRWSVWVNGNWRLTFKFQDGHAYVLDYEDYH